MQVRTDLHNFVHLVPAIYPVSGAGDNTAQVSQIIDMQGVSGVEFAILLGAIADADATFAVTMDHGDAANLSDAAAVTATTGLVGTLAAAGFQFDSDNTVRKVGYNGIKRYVRLTITPSANTGAWLVGVVAVQLMNVQPAANP